MKKIFAIVLLVVLFSCKDQNEQQTKTLSTTTETTPIATEPKKPLPEFPYPVAMANWTMGDPGNTKKVLDMYKAWEINDSAVFASSFVDPAAMDMPDARRLTLNNEGEQKKLYQARNRYKSVTNKIVSAFAMHNEENNADWVMVMVYNKWTYKNGIKDSALYWENWRMKDGKIAYLSSLEQLPSKTLLKALETKLE